jgi:ribosomal protein S18 acetylase RimI-like enzyme
LTAGPDLIPAARPLPFEVGPIGRGEVRAAARVLGTAFLDDPISTAIGPRRRAHRRITSPVSFMGILVASQRHRGRVRVARHHETGRVAGVSVAFEPGAWPVPEGAFAYEIGWLLMAGPLPLRRAIAFDRKVRAAHVPHPHMYLWFLGVDPAVQARGIGKALLADVHAEAAANDVPTYLETGTMANVTYYASVGYEVLGEINLSTGEPMWLMHRG